jgi:hypothetical protein
MLMIRHEQLRALGQAPNQQFQDNLMQYSESFYPEECQAMGQHQLRLFVRHAIDVSTAEGYPLEREIAYFLSLMFMLGIDFHCDPQLPWNFGSIGDSRLVDRAGKMDDFFAGAMEYLDETAGPDNEHLVRAMIRVRNYDFNQVPALGADFVEKVGDVLERFFPEKFAYQGEAVTWDIIRAGTEQAAQYGIRDHQGLFCYSALMFMEGSGMHKDPVYGWIGRILNEPGLSAPGARGMQLFRAAKEHIAESLRADSHS